MNDHEDPNGRNAGKKDKLRDLADLLGLPDSPGEPEVSQDSTESYGRIIDPPPPDAPVLWMDDPKQKFKALNNLRMVKNALIRLGHQSGEKFFLFTGPSRKVGVSVLTFNLALVLAQDLLDRRILIVDGHVSNPALHTYFSVTPSPGVLNFILDGQTLDQVAIPSHIPNLYLATLGVPNHQASSPFDLVRFQQFIEETRARFDLILMDSGPGLGAGHTRVISPQVDGVVIVAEADKTRWEVLSELKRQLETDGAEVVGGILNKRRFVIPKKLYRFI